jgi:3-oxoacyl-[acyl-carrier protein] reductase
MQIIDKFEAIQIGDEAEIFHTISEKDVDSFVALTGDNNPLHVDEDFASKTTFKKRVVHGMLTASFISTMIGAKLPGTGSLLYEQQIRFLSPVRIGGIIRVWAKVRHKSKSQRIVVLETVVFDEQENRVIEGEAKVKILKQEKIKEMKMPDQNKGAIIVSGASRGIGAAIAKGLAREGYPVVINYFHSAAQAEILAKEIIEEDGKAITCKADVSNEQDVKKMVELTLSTFEYIHGIVNNASGPIEIKDFAALTWEDMQGPIDIQLKGAFNMTQSVISHFIEQGRGVIVNIASIVTDNIPPAKWLPYNIAKSALVNFNKSIANEYGVKGIRSNCVSPGMTQTDLIADLPEKVKMVTKMQTPLRRLTIPEDVSGTVSYLFSEQASFVTGQNIRVCGGMVMP